MVFPLTVCAVNVTCHIPTIDGESSSSSLKKAERIKCAEPIWGCQAAGLKFLLKPHCAEAPGIINTAITSAARTVTNLQLIDLIYFLLGRGTAGALQR